jgi:hypothetical protein
MNKYPIKFIEYKKTVIEEETKVIIFNHPSHALI